MNVREKIDHILLDFRYIINETQRQFIRDAILAIEVEHREPCPYDTKSGQHDECTFRCCPQGADLECLITHPVTIGELAGENEHE
jgi:hypothetical protein